MGGLAAWLMQLQFSLFGLNINLGDVSATLENLLSFTQIYSLDRGEFPAIIAGVQSIVQISAAQILFLFFIIHMAQMAMEVQEINWQRIVMECARFFVFKLIVDHAGQFLSLLFTIGDNMLASISDYFGSITAGHIPDLWSNVARAIDEASFVNNAEWYSGMLNFFGPLLAFICFLCCYIPLLATAVGLIGQVFIRVFKVVALMCFCPIPLAVGAFDEGNSAKRFILQAAAIILEGFIVLVVIYLYRAGIFSLNLMSASSDGTFVFLGYMIGITVCNGIFMGVLNMAGQMAERWLGA